MAQQDLKYITGNYLTLEELAQKTDLSTTTILLLIDEKVIQAASYTIVESVEISSPLGDSVTHKISTDFYASSNVQLLLNVASSANRESAKALFKEQFRNLLVSQPDRNFAYGNIFNEAGKLVEEGFEKAFEAEWEAYTAGYTLRIYRNQEEKQSIV